MKFEGTTALRHTPKQIRGQRKVDHILRSAEALFAEVGFENATTNAISARAGVSIGSLYQFFASKDAILEAMADRYLEQTRLELGRLMESAAEFELDEFLSRIIAVSIKLQEQRPYFLQCLSVSQPSPSLSRGVNRLVNELTNYVLRLLERAAVETDAKNLRMRARICVVLLGSMLPLALHARGRERSRAVNEIKLMLKSYLEPMLKVPGKL